MKPPFVSTSQNFKSLPYCRITSSVISCVAATSHRWKADIHVTMIDRRPNMEQANVAEEDGPFLRTESKVCLQRQV